MTPVPETSQNPDDLSPELDRHLSDPAQKTEEVSGEQDKAARRNGTPSQQDEIPTEPGVSTENQPT